MGRERAKRGLATALVFSLLLHAALLGVFYPALLQGPRPAEAAFILNVGLVPAGPQPLVPAPRAPRPAAPAPMVAEAGAALPNRAGPAGDSAPAALPAPPADPPAPAVTPPLQLQAAGPLTPDTAPPPAAPSAGTDLATAALDRVRLQASISTFLDGDQQTLQSTWDAICWRERQARRRRDCDEAAGGQQRLHEEERQRMAELFAGLRREERDARLRQDFASQNVTLRALMAGRGPLALLAAERFALNREYQEYLSGNFNYAIWGFVQMTQSGNGNLPFLRDLYQGVCSPAPCVYDFSLGPARHTAETPAAADAGSVEDAGAGTDAPPPLRPFRLAAPLFRATPGG